LEEIENIDLSTSDTIKPVRENDAYKCLAMRRNESHQQGGLAATFDLAAFGL